MASPQQPKLRLKDRRRRLMWVKVAAGSSVVALSLAFVWYVGHLPAVTISSIEVSGTTIVSAEAVKTLVGEQLKGSYAYIIPHNNSLVFPEQHIRSQALLQFPPIASLSISRVGLTGLSITVEERAPVALWCGDSVTDEGATDTGCYSVDKNGFIFAKVETQDAFVRFYGSVGESPIGKTYLDGGFASLSTLVKDIGIAIKRTPKTVVTDPTTKDVALTFADGGVLKFVQTTNEQATLDNVASVFASQSFKTNKQFEYVDFRFGDKVYVKFKGE